MTTDQVRRNPWAAEAELLRRIARQERIDTIVFRAILIVLAIGGSALIVWRNIQGGWGAAGTDIALVGMYLTVIALTWRNDARG